MICRQNNWDAMIGDNIFLINGLVGYITNIDLEFSTAKRLTIDFRPEFLSESFYDLALDREYLRLPFQYRKSYISRMNKFEYGYAITCHLAQGSQYNKVIVVNEPLVTHCLETMVIYGSHSCYRPTYHSKLRRIYGFT